MQNVNRNPTTAADDGYLQPRAADGGYLQLCRPPSVSDDVYEDVSDESDTEAQVDATNPMTGVSGPAAAANVNVNAGGAKSSVKIPTRRPPSSRCHSKKMYILLTLGIVLLVITILAVVGVFVYFYMENANLEQRLGDLTSSRKYHVNYMNNVNYVNYMNNVNYVNYVNCVRDLDRGDRLRVVSIQCVFSVTRCASTWLILVCVCVRV